MKLRIRGNTLRFRLTQGEVESLAQGRAVQESVELGGEPFVYEVIPEEKAPALTARSSAWRISLVMPAGMAREWHGSQQVGKEGETATGCKLLIEKDFACLQPRGPDEDADAFPNPGTSC
jgi:hypothetical protein